MSDRWGTRFYKAAAVVLILLGCVHSLAVFNKPVASNDTERQLFDLMTNYKRDLMGSMRSTGDIVRGFNISFVILPLALGVLNLVLSRERPTLLKRLALINVLWLAAMVANSLYNWFLAPTLFLVIALVLFAGAGVKLPAGEISPPGP
jgi:multisubunit Na+/H+ antiporter MnhF subunit